MVIVGCGRAGAGLAQAGEVVAVVDEELGVVTVSSTDWAMGKIPDHLEHRTLKEEISFGRGEVSLLRLELPRHLVDRTVAGADAGPWSRPTRSSPSPPSRPSPTGATSSAAGQAAPTSPPADLPGCGTLPPRNGM